MPDLPRRFVALVSRLAPGWARREFRAEWEAELSTDPSMRRALGALPDAWFLFRQQGRLDMLGHDVRYALRLMRQRPAYTLLVIATLALGIGASTAMFSAIHAVLLRPLPFRDPGRLVMIWENDRLNGKPRYPVAPANFDDWRKNTSTLASVAGWIPQEGTLRPGGGEPFHANSAVVTTNFLDTLGVMPLLGRGFTPDDRPPSQHVMLLSHAAWMSHFGGDPAVVDRVFTFGDTGYRVVGVMPRGFDFPDRAIDVWRPLADNPDLMATRDGHFMFAVARVKPEFSLAQSAQDLERVAVAAQRKYPLTNEQRGTTMVPLQEAVVGDVRAPLYYLGAAVGLLLLIGCANIANLMLAQASTRRREMAVRAALGAGRVRLARQLLVEGLILALASGAAGLALAWQATQVIARFAAGYVPRVATIGFDPAVLAFTAAVSIGTGLLFTLVPALRASRPDVQRDLRDAGRGATPQGRRLRDALVVLEFAAAVVLVAGGALLLESFWHVLRVNPGFTTTHVASIDPDLPEARYSTSAAINQFYVDLIARLDAIPGVRAAAVNNVPLSGDAWTSWLMIENRPRPSGEPPEVGYRTATPGYLSVMGIALRQGRWIADSDTPASMRVAVVNQALAERFFPAGDAVGSRIHLGPNPKAPWKTIVGVIGNVHHSGPESAPQPEAYGPFAQDPFVGAVVIRADLDRAATVRTVRAAAASIDPAIVVARVRWLDALMDEHLAPRRLSMLLVEGFAAVALALALLGIYGVVSYTVAQRVPEIGVRIALGAAPRAIHRMVLRDGLRLALPGLATGLVGALAVARLARSLLFNVSPADPATFAAVLAAMLAVATLACYVPARRASRVDPIAAIRAE